MGGELPVVLKDVDTADELSRGRWRALGVFEWCARSCSSPRIECTRSRQVAWKGGTRTLDPGMMNSLPHSK